VLCVFPAWRRRCLLRLLYCHDRSRQRPALAIGHAVNADAKSREELFPPFWSAASACLSCDRQRPARAATADVDESSGHSAAVML
jgi:hypothetical protein